MNGDPITLAEFQERFARAGLKPDREAELEVKEEFLNRLIERKMMLREAQRRRIKIAPPEINKRIEALRDEQGKDVKDILAGLGIDFEKWKSDIWEDMMIERLIARDVNRSCYGVVVRGQAVLPGQPAGVREAGAGPRAPDRRGHGGGGPEGHGTAPGSGTRTSPAWRGRSRRRPRRRGGATSVISRWARCRRSSTSSSACPRAG